MRFLEAQALLRGFTSDVKRSVTLCTSARAEPLDLYLRAEFAARGVDAEIATLPFGTLQQHLRSAPRGPHEMLVLFPWDLAPMLDWRSGIPSRSLSKADLREMIAPMESLLAGGEQPLFYIPAEIPPVGGGTDSADQLAALLQGAALRLGAHVVPSDHFSLPNYLSSGGAFTSSRAGDLGALIVAHLTQIHPEPKKVLLTDLDGVMWHGVIGEDGPDGIRSAPEGDGYPHFLYQSLLRRLRGEGVLLAAVSKNDEDLARLPFHNGEMTLAEEDFVAILASYDAKSVQISSLARALNLPVDSMVFVDDNPVEIAEVSAQLPTITTMQFPCGADALAPFLHSLSAHFARPQRTAEDAARTEMYRSLLASPVPSAADPASVEHFLRDLQMRLRISDRSNGHRERAIQLINKTNQFNLNGQRVTDAEVEATLARGGKLITATLEDRNGSHGEILACIVQPDASISTFVMSCRVMQRRVELAFFRWLAEHVVHGDSLVLHFVPTERNTPIRNFLREAGFGETSARTWRIARETLLRDHVASTDLFALETAQ